MFLPIHTLSPYPLVFATVSQQTISCIYSPLIVLCIIMGLCIYSVYLVVDICCLWLLSSFCDVFNEIRNWLAVLFPVLTPSPFLDPCLMKPFLCRLFLCNNHLFIAKSRSFSVTQKILSGFYSEP